MLSFILWLLTTDIDTGLQLTLNNIQLAQGSIYVAVYDNEHVFLDPVKMRYQKIVQVRKTGQLDISFADLPQGTYSISCFHDVNGNGKLDTNLLGIPTEPYGFSNNTRPKFRAPNWGEAKFTVRNNGEKHIIRLEKW